MTIYGKTIIMNHNIMLSVHEQFMRLALNEAEQALEAGEFPVGCIIVREKSVIAKGSRIHSSKIESCNELDHAEIVALRNASCSLPLIDKHELTVYSTMEPCLMCYATLLVSGIEKIVYAYEDAMGGGTNMPLTQLSPLYRDLQVEITPHVLRRESLHLFQKFFSKPDCSYLKESYLAQYTLAQSLK